MKCLEQNSKLERSTNGGETFESIVIMNGKGGSVGDYTYMDWDIGGKNPGTYINYRLKVNLPDGRNKMDVPRGKKQKMPGIPRPSVTSEVIKLSPDPGGNLKVNYRLSRNTDVTMILLNPKMELVKRKIFNAQSAGSHSQLMDISDIKPGKYQLVVKAGRDVVKRYRVSF